jgi:5'(3')-deoxyribonucleotidase
MFDKPVILIDMDSIVVDLMTPWLGEYNRLYDDNLTMDRILTWDTHEYVKPVCGKKVYDLLTEDLFKGLQPLPGAVSAVNHISGRYNAYFVTAAPAGTADAKVAWVKKYFPQMSNKVFTGKDKWIVAGDALIDDSGDNLTAYKAHHPDALTISIRYKYNEDVNVDLSAESGNNTEAAWAQIVSFIDERFG